MNLTKLLIGTIAGTIVGFIAGYLIFGMALSGYMADNMAMKDPPEFLFLIAGHLAFAFLLTYIFLQWAGIKTASTGAKAGAIIGCLATLAMNWTYLGVTDMITGGCMTAIVDAIASGVVWAIGGAAIGWALGRGE